MNQSYSGKEREMNVSGANPEEKQSFWERLFGRYDTGRERKVVEYVAHRLRDGAHLRDALGKSTPGVTPRPMRRSG